eukprot:TRINITY_DN7813_c1_g1_i1.p1 TRINITY_DN7813_c1_g1~~TRINITY_DN7813_c1_g1_i1.p1  ORF type:complete len:971 (-),score=189.17 TRINITY_DN7813_c1_g1_i1:93-2795(-)
MGVAIVADKFMGAIETITSRRKQVRQKKTNKLVTVSIWNPTVANLTLMALGSSAPEILLSVIELFTKGMYSGDLGPSTILGSASFNLMVIIGLCVAVIPAGEGRKVQQLAVLYITTVFSLLAYFWMVFIIQVITPNVVDPWEAIVTLLLFPLLTFISYLADIGYLQQLLSRSSMKRWNSKDDVPDEVVDRGCETLGHTDEETKLIVRQVIYENPEFGDLSNPSLEVIQHLWELSAEHCKGVHASRAARRQDAMRWLTNTKKKEQYVWNNGANLVQFDNSVVYALPSASETKVIVLRHGDILPQLDLHYTVNLSVDQDEPRKSMKKEKKEKVQIAVPRRASNREEQLEPRGLLIAEGKVVIESGESSTEIVVSSPTMETFGSNCFEVRLTNVSIAKRVSLSAGRSMSKAAPPHWNIGERYLVRIQTMITESRGLLTFPCERLQVSGSPNVQDIEVVVQRQEGCCDAVSCAFRTERLSAVPGYDYLETAGILTFEEGITEQRIPITILPKKSYERSDDFLVVLEDPTGGARFDPRDDGGCDSTILTVTVENDRKIGTASTLLRILDIMFNLDEVQLGLIDWKEQFICAVYCNGSAEEQQEASFFDWLFHVLSLPWKLLFALLPPTTYFAGWPLFWSALGAIALVTGIIGDLAELFGCVLEIPNTVTALTFVAMGTSMPDLFASRAAATQDSTADASICNVTGSNSVNVFLGLGIPWTIGALYWTGKDKDQNWEDKYGPLNGNMAAVLNYKPAFVVQSGNLGFSVAAFLCYAVIILSVLFLRRSCLSYELGGPVKLKMFTGISFFLVWCSYTALVCWQAIRQAVAPTGEAAGVFICLIGVALALWAAMLAWTVAERGWMSEEQAQAAEEAALALERLESLDALHKISAEEEIVIKDSLCICTV